MTEDFTLRARFPKIDDPVRGTGRTTRMLVEAMLRALRGEQVLVIARDVASTRIFSRTLRSMIQHVTGRTWDWNHSDRPKVWDPASTGLVMFASHESTLSDLNLRFDEIYVDHAASTPSPGLLSLLKIKPT